MTEKQKFEGKFIQRQREKKEAEKKSKATEEQQSKIKEDTHIEKGKKKSLRRFLEDEKRFRGLLKTAEALLEDVRKMVMVAERREDEGRETEGEGGESVCSFRGLRRRPRF